MDTVSDRKIQMLGSDRELLISSVHFGFAAIKATADDFPSCLIRQGARCNYRENFGQILAASLAWHLILRIVNLWILTPVRLRLKCSAFSHPSHESIVSRDIFL
jgi:hypothetical protein